MADKLAGKVTHFYDQIGVGVVKLDIDLKIGDEIRVGEEGEGFTQKVESMQVDHKPMNEAKKGDEVGMKLDKETKRGAKIYLV